MKISSANESSYVCLYYIRQITGYLKYLCNCLRIFYLYRSNHRFQPYVKEGRWEIDTAILL